MHTPSKQRVCMMTENGRAKKPSRVQVAVHGNTEDAGVHVRADRREVSEPMGRECEVWRDNAWLYDALYGVDQKDDVCEAKRERAVHEGAGALFTQGEYSGRSFDRDGVQKQKMPKPNAHGDLGQAKAWDKAKKGDNSSAGAAEKRLGEVEFATKGESQGGVADPRAERHRGAEGGHRKEEAPANGAGAVAQRKDNAKHFRPTPIPTKARNQAAQKRPADGCNGQGVRFHGGGENSDHKRTVSTEIPRADAGVGLFDRNRARGSDDNGGRRVCGDGDGERKDGGSTGTSKRKRAGDDDRGILGNKRSEKERSSMVYKEERQGDPAGSVGGEDLFAITQDEENKNAKLRRNSGGFEGRAADGRNEKIANRYNETGTPDGDHLRKHSLKSVRFSDEPAGPTPAAERHHRRGILKNAGDDDASRGFDEWLHGLLGDGERHGQDAERGAEGGDPGCGHKEVHRKRNEANGQKHAGRKHSESGAPVRKPGRPPKPKIQGQCNSSKENGKGVRAQAARRGSKENEEGDSTREWWNYSESAGSSSQNQVDTVAAADEAFRIGKGNFWLDLPARFVDVGWQTRRENIRRFEGMCKMMEIGCDFTSNETRFGIVHSCKDVLERQRQQKKKQFEQSKPKPNTKKVVPFHELYGLPMCRFQTKKDDKTMYLSAKEKGYISVIEMPRVYKGYEIPDFDKKELPHIVNMTVTFWLGVSEIDRIMLAATLPGACFNPERFKSVMVPIMMGDSPYKPSMNALVFHSGKVVFAGPKSKEQGLEAAYRFARYLRVYGGIQGATVVNFSVKNIVTCANTGGFIDLAEFARSEPENVHWRPEIFPPITLKIDRNSNEKALIYASGNFVVGGANNIERVKEIIVMIYQKGEKYKSKITKPFTAAEIRLSKRQNLIGGTYDAEEINEQISGEVPLFDKILDRIAYVSMDGAEPVSMGKLTFNDNTDKIEAVNKDMELQQTLMRYLYLEGLENEKKLMHGDDVY